jgi:hypothetical protein
MAKIQATEIERQKEVEFKMKIQEIEEKYKDVL